MLKRLALLLSLVAALSVGGTALASSASAANCTAISAGTIVYDGSWWWQGQANGCTLVNAVEFTSYASGLVYMQVLTKPVAYHYPYSGGGTVYAPGYPLDGYGVYTSTYHFTIWGSGCPNTFPVQRVFQYRIHNSGGGGSWGSWHQFVSPIDNLC